MNERFDLFFILFYTGIPFLVIGLIGNVLVLRIIHKREDMKAPTNFLLMSVGFSDVITILLWPLYFFEFAKFLCKLVVLIEISIMVSSITLTLLAVERYHAVLKPFHTGLRLSNDNIKHAVASIWIASVIICSPEFFLKEWSETYSQCTGPWSLHMNQASKIYVFINLTIFCIQTVIMLYCYGCVIKGLYFTNIVYPETVRHTASEKQKVVITLILATAGFLAGYTPTVIVFLLKASGNDKHIDFQSVSDLLFVCSLSFNPIIYGFRGAKFQEYFKRMLWCRKPISLREINFE